MQVAAPYRADNNYIQMRFLQMSGLFSMLSLLCNYPHFMVSYQLAYNRGHKFILSNWFALIFIPFTLMGFYGFAYLNLETPITDSWIITQINAVFKAANLSFNLGSSGFVGQEIVSLSIWFMYLSVGWHYSKQVYGCMMVYAFYDNYPLKKWHKKLLKYGVFSIGIYQLFYISHTMDQYSRDGSFQDMRFQGFSISSLGIPDWMINTSLVVTAILLTMFILILFAIFYKEKKLPSINFLVPWVALFIWWIPLNELPEFYLITIPFFHSLQYLPFALRIKSAKEKPNRWSHLKTFRNVFTILILGVAAFELIPLSLDKTINNNHNIFFFCTTIAVFINIHHFFIDSVIWKLKDKKVSAQLLYKYM